MRVFIWADLESIIIIIRLKITNVFPYPRRIYNYKSGDF